MYINNAQSEKAKFVNIDICWKLISDLFPTGNKKEENQTFRERGNIHKLMKLNRGIKTK